MWYRGAEDCPNRKRQKELHSGVLHFPFGYQILFSLFVLEFINNMVVESLV